MIAVGDVLNETYEVIGEIGQGGTGVVYLAYHRRLQKQVVIKKIREDFVGKIYERAEADLLKSLHHEYLPQVYDFVQTGHTVYTLLDYVE